MQKKHPLKWTDSAERRKAHCPSSQLSQQQGEGEEGEGEKGKGRKREVEGGRGVSSFRWGCVNRPRGTGAISRGRVLGSDDGDRSRDTTRANNIPRLGRILAVPGHMTRLKTSMTFPPNRAHLGDVAFSTDVTLDGLATVPDLA